MNAQTVPGLFRQRVQESPESTAYCFLDKQGKWQPVSWDQAGKNVLDLTQGLIELGLQPGDHVGILAPTSMNWELVQMAVLTAGGVVVGIDVHDTESNVQAIASRSAINCLVVQAPELAHKLDSQTLSRLRFVLVLDHSAQNLEGYPTLDSIQNRQPRGHLQDLDLVALYAPATVIFTSGTTGNPKGIRYTHQQVVLACRSIAQAFPDLQAGSKLVCWLPLSNLFQRMINHCAVLLNAQTYFVPDPRKILDFLSEIKPDVFVGVPRFFEKMHEGMMQEVRKKPALVRGLVEKAFQVGDEQARALRENRPENMSNKLMQAVLDRLILQKFRKTFGGNVRFMISGSAPMPKCLLQRYHAMGLLILEAYGISENIVPMAMNRPQSYKFGTVGLPLAANEIRLTAEGEVLVKGPGVCSAYYTDPKEQSLVDQQGYLHTGDLAAIDEQGFISLLGRNSEMIKTSTGRRIAPAPIENSLRTIQAVEHAMLLGDNRKYPVAILVLSDPDMLRSDNTKATSQDLTKDTSPQQQLEHIRQQVHKHLQDLPQYQRPAGLIVTQEQFTVQGGELTANLKMRRKVIEDKYASHIQALYQALEAGGPEKGGLKVISA
ncbi:MAG: AMP-dependent synthetase/ligase [Desulfohalobiaceae bacterium]